MRNEFAGAFPPWFALSLVIGIGLALRIGAICFFKHSPESDELAYQSMAIHLVRSNIIVDHLGNYAMYNVGYPLFVLAPIYFIFGETLLGVQLANLFLGGLAILLCYQIAKEAGAGQVGRLLASAIWALYLPASVYAVYLFKENLMVPLMLGVVWCALRMARKPTLMVVLICGILFGLLALSGNAALSIVPIVAVAILYSPLNWPHRAVTGFLIMAIASAVSTPWLIRNARVLGVPILNTNGGFNLYLGNNPAATGKFISIADTPRGSTWQTLREIGEVQASATLGQEAKSWIKANPIPFSQLALKKAVYFWAPPLHQGQGTPSFLESLVRSLWAIQYLLLLVAALATVLLQSLRSKSTILLWIAIVCYSGVHMLFYVVFRYREPIMPYVGILAALAMESWISRRWRNTQEGRTLMDSQAIPELVTKATEINRANVW